jgi:hypothetical protein
MAETADRLAETVHLSEAAVASLRFRIKGFPLREQDWPAFRELVAAGIVEPASGAGYRFTAWGMEHREAILERESDRIERERYEPPDSNISEAARETLRRHLAGDKKVTEANLAAYRELAAARIMYPVSGFTTGPEANFRFTYWGWHRREEWLSAPAAAPPTELP